MDQLVNNLKDRPNSLDILTRVPNLRKEKKKKEDNFMSELKSKTHSKFFSKNKRPKSSINKINDVNDEDEEVNHIENEIEDDIKMKSAENFHSNKNNAISKSKLNNISDKTLIYELRNTFQKSLAKLNNNDTKEVGYKELVSIISKFNNSQSLRVFISLISISHKNCTIAAKELQVMLIGVIAQVFQENLQDPLDKPPSIIKTIDRLIRVIHSFMKENSDIIHYACAETIVQLFQHCMPKDDIIQIVKLFIDYPVTAIESGINLMVQKASALALSSIITFFEKEEANIILDSIATSIIKLVLKTSFDSPYLYESLITLVNTVKFEYFSNNFKELYEKVVIVLENPKTYDNSKINICRLLKIIGEKIKERINSLIGFYVSDITNALRNTTKDRVHKVQIASREALRVWLEVEKLNDELENKKMNIKIEKGEDEDMQDLKNKIIRNLDDENLNNNEADGKTNNESIFNYNNQNKLNLLKNLSKLNKNSTSNTNKHINNYSKYIDSKNFNNLSKEEIFKKGLSNMLRISGSQEKNDNKENQYYEHHLKYGKNMGKERILPSELVRQSINKVNDNEDSFEINVCNEKQEDSNDYEDKPKNKLNENLNKSNLTGISNRTNTRKNKIDIEEDKNNNRSNNNKKQTISQNLNDSLEEKTNNSKRGNYSNEMTFNNKNKLAKQDSKLQSKNQNLPTHSPKFNQRRIENKKNMSNSNINSKNQDLESVKDKHNKQLQPISSNNNGKQNGFGNKDIQNNNSNFNRNELKTFKSTISSIVNNLSINSVRNYNFLNSRLDELDNKLTKTSKNTIILKKNIKLIKQVNKSNDKNELKNNDNKDHSISDNSHISNKNIENADNKILKSKLLDLENQVDDKEEIINNLRQEINDLLNKINQLETYNQQLKSSHSVINKSRTMSHNSNVNKDESKNKENNLNSNYLLQEWKNVLILAEKGDFNEAYNEILNNGDDIYLLRLLCLTGPIISKLNPITAKNLIFRINMIARSHQVQNLTYLTIKASYEEKVFLAFTKNEQNDLLETLFEISDLNSKVGKSAAKLYTRICDSFHE